MNLKVGKKRPKVLLSGYFGFDNAGDEAILYSMIHCLRKLKPELRITALSGNPKKTRELYEVNAVNRWNPISVTLALLSCRLFISGGGSLLQDVTSSKSLSYYLAVIRLAAFLKKRIMIYSQGIGPLTNEKNRAKVSGILNRCEVITVRDESSAKLLKELGVRQDVQQVCDPVMALGSEDIDEKEIAGDLRALGIPDENGKEQKPLLLAIIRNWGENKHIMPIAELLDMQARDGWNILLVPAQYPGDMEAINRIAESMKEQVLIIDKNLTARRFLALTAFADKVLSMRLHGLICAMAVGRPMLGLSYDPKVDAFMKQAGLERYCLPYDGFSKEMAGGLMRELDFLPPEFKQAQETRRREMQKQAWATAEIAAGMLDTAKKR